MTSSSIPLGEAFRMAGGARRIYFVWSRSEKRLRVSHPGLGDIARAIEENARDFDAHEALFLENAMETESVFGAFLHRTVRGQGAGGVRHFRYDTLDAFITDGLRLARGMGRKNALAGLWWGGGKGIIARAPEARYAEAGFRNALYQGYGRFITSLRGAYVTAEDVGTSPADMASVFRATRFTTCIPPSLGGSGNPSPWTARGVVRAMEAACAGIGIGTLDGKTVAMQGIGNVGEVMVELLVQAGAARIVAADVDEAACDRVRRRHDGRVQVRLVRPGDSSILSEPCDILAPNALGGVLGPETIPHVSAAVVCGAANNQLLDERRDSRALEARGVAYVPDFLANRMGIVNCANEQYGTLPEDPAIVRHLGRDDPRSIYNTVLEVFERAKRHGVTTIRAATELADELALEPHPLFGHRTRAIIESLVDAGWETGADDLSPLPDAGR